MSAEYPRTARRQILCTRTVSFVCWLGWQTANKVCRLGLCGRTKEFLFLLKICSAARVLRTVHCADCRQPDTRGNETDFIAKIRSQCYWRLQKTASVATYCSVTANLIERGTLSRSFLPVFWILGPIFWGQNLKSYFSPVSRIVESWAVLSMQLAKKVGSVLKSTLQESTKRLSCFGRFVCMYICVCVYIYIYI